MLSILTSHPIQYQAPLWQALAHACDGRVEVWFLTNHGLKASFDREFGQTFAWDIDLLAGYPSHFLSVKPGWTLDSFRGIELAGNWEDVLIARRTTALWVEGWRFLAFWKAIRAAHKLRIPVWMRGDSNDLKQHSWPKALVKRPFMKNLFGKVDYFLTVGSANKRLYEGYGVPQSKLFSAPHYVDNDRFDAAAQRLAAEKHALRERWNIPADAFCVLFCGKFISKKRPQDLVTAAELLQSESNAQPLHLLMVGSGELEQALKARCQVSYDGGRPIDARPTGRPKASFTGFLNQREVPAAYAVADLLVLPSDADETWGLVINEAIASGRPAAASNLCGSAEDLVAQIDPRLVFRYQDPQDLARSIRLAQSAKIPLARLQLAADSHHMRHTVQLARRLMAPSRT